MILICMDRLSAKIAKVGCRGKRKLFFRSGNARMYPIGSTYVKDRVRESYNVAGLEP